MSTDYDGKICMLVVIHRLFLFLIPNIFYYIFGLFLGYFQGKKFLTRDRYLNNHLF